MKKTLITLVLSSLVLAAFVYAQPSTQPQNFEFSWTPPTKNIDGSPLADLAGYHLCISIDKPIPADLKKADMPTACSVSVDVGAPADVSVQSVELAVRSAGTLYARIAAFDTSGNVSDFSNEAFADFDFMPADSSTFNLTIIKK